MILFSSFVSVLSLLILYLRVKRKHSSQWKTRSHTERLKMERFCVFCWSVPPHQPKLYGFVSFAVLSFSLSATRFHGENLLSWRPDSSVRWKPFYVKTCGILHKMLDPGKNPLYKNTIMKPSLQTDFFTKNLYLFIWTCPKNLVSFI